MKSFLVCSAVFLLVCFSCRNSDVEWKNKMALEPKILKHEKTAVFAEGCFWYSELVFESLVGVRQVLSGYSGGIVSNPVYEQVSGGLTGHAEAVKVYYDPSKIAYQTLVKAFFTSHDPTSINRQGLDEGSEYRSIAFYNSEDEKQILLKILDTLQARSGQKIVTEILPLKEFYPAEEFHQDYASKNPENSYVKYVCVPAFLDFRFKFKGNFKSDSLSNR